MAKYDLFDDKGTAVEHTEEAQDDGTTNITSEGLTPNSTYSKWSIQEAGNADTKTVIQDFKTADVLPATPSITVVAGVESVTYTITPPATNTGSAIIGYKIYYSDGNESKTFDAQMNLTGSITGLTASLPYNFTVTATNGAGETEQSAVSPATPTATA